MIRLFSVIFILLLLSYNGIGQSIKDRLYKTFMAADSLVLVSHLTTYAPIVLDATTTTTKSYRLVERNKVNYKIIKEYYRLDKNETDSLFQILITPNNDSIIENIRCFMPHHGILIFKKNKCSYFDICFGCRHFLTSKDIKLTDELDDKTWKKLKAFFKTRQLNYGMEYPDSELADEN